MSMAQRIRRRVNENQRRVPQQRHHRELTSSSARAFNSFSLLRETMEMCAPRSTS